MPNKSRRSEDSRDSMPQNENCPSYPTLPASEEIPTEPVPLCLHCGGSGRPLYTGLSDRLFGVPGTWGHSQCPQCGLVWLNPRPLPEALGRTYRTYYTHGRRRRFAALQESLKRGLFSTILGCEGIAGSPLWRLAGEILSWLPSWQERAILGTMCLNGAGKQDKGVKKTLLDVGCGDGEFLSLMRDAGWEVAGIEPDPAAADRAERVHDIQVIAPTVQAAPIAPGSVDAVTLSHVLEHAADPLALLRDCRRWLKPQGKIVIVTPNLASRGSRHFRDSWVHLDPPRHLYLFSPATLRHCCQQAGLRVERLRTSARTAAWVWAASDSIRRKGSFSRESDHTWRRRIVATGLLAEEEISRRMRGLDRAGDELVLIGGQ